MKTILLSSMLMFAMSAEAATVCTSNRTSGKTQVRTRVVVNQQASAIYIKTESIRTESSRFGQKVDRTSSTATRRVKSVQRSTLATTYLDEKGLVLRVDRDGEGLFADRMPDGSPIYRTLNCR